jgi:hypothetical protein
MHRAKGFWFSSEETIGGGILSLLLVTAFWGGVSVMLYGERFLVGVYPFSDLGVPYTVSKLPNLWSCVAFDMCLLLNAAISALLCGALLSERAGPRRIVGGTALGLAAAGFLLAISPHTTLPFLHALGSGLAVGGWWLFLTVRLGIRRGSVMTDAAVQAILQGTVLTYAFAFAFDLPGMQALQAAAIGGLALAALWCSFRLRSARSSAARVGGFRER